MSSQASTSGPTHLFSFLGTGLYEPSSYAWNFDASSGRSVESKFIQVVLVDILGAAGSLVDRITIFLTPEARSTHFDALKSALVCYGFEGEIVDVDIPNGVDERELWSLFKILFSSISSSLHQSVVFDITHGFRALPWFQASVVCFLAATKQLPDAARVFYGQYDRKCPSASSVVELTPALDVVSWGFGLAQFLQQGRWSGELSDYLRSRSKSLNANLRASGEQARDFFNGLNSRLNEVSEALSVVRVGDLLLENPRQERTAALKGLVEQLRLSKRDVEEHLPPLAVMLAQVEERFAHFDRDGRLYHLSGDEGLQQLLHLTQLYRDWDRLPEATTVLKEAFTTLFTSEPAASAPVAHKGGESAFRTEGREMADRRANEWLYAHAKGLLDFRNDINHAGFNKQPKSKKDLATAFDKALNRYKELKDECQSLRRPLLLNITNHPTSDWCEAQTAAAKTLAPEIVNVPFPAVDPQLSDAKFQTLVRQFLREMDDSGLIDRTSHALVMGDFGMTFALVERLKAHGIECWVTTTTRRVSDQKFEFGRLRRI